MSSRILSQEVLLGPVFDALPVGVVVLDAGGLVRVFNAHEEKLANRRRERVMGRPFFAEIAPCMDVRELAGEFFAHVGSGDLDTKVEVSFPFPNVDQPRDVIVRMQSIVVEGSPHGMLLVEDVSMQRAVERMKESLAALLVHDFKNPLSVITSNLEFVRSNTDTAAVLEAIDDGILASKQLHAMVLNLLDVARLETGTFPIDRAMIDVAELVRDAVRANAALARSAGAELVASASETVEAFVDAAILRRALANVIENALRHAPDGTAVVVSASKESGVVVLRVADQGPGVPKDLRDSIFEKFSQGSREGRTTGNRGLGLTFVRMAARAHGGDAYVEDTTGRGAVFAIRLPDGVPTVAMLGGLGA